MPSDGNEMIRACGPQDFEAMLRIINDAADAYRAFIPPAEWKEPYMPAQELRQEIGAGVRFTGYAEQGELIGIMGLQDVQEVALIRHAYTDPLSQRRGIGSALHRELRSQTDRPFLVGTWAASSWAIRFYQRHGYRQVPETEGKVLLRRYWSVPESQIAASIVLADDRWHRARSE
jgi:GNAT superfamily N-acetyltransferase